MLLGEIAARLESMETRQNQLISEMYRHYGHNAVQETGFLINSISGYLKELKAFYKEIVASSDRGISFCEYLISINKALHGIVDGIDNPKIDITKCEHLEEAFPSTLCALGLTASYLKCLKDYVLDRKRDEEQPPKMKMGDHNTVNYAVGDGATAANNSTVSWSNVKEALESAAVSQDLQEQLNQLATEHENAPDVETKKSVLKRITDLALEHPKELGKSVQTITTWATKLTENLG